MNPSTSPPLGSLPKIAEIAAILGQIAPLELAESWDNVGLLAGDSQTEVDRIMTCLTIAPRCVQEAIDKGAKLIVAHHPLPFKPVSRVVASTTVGSSLLSLLRHGIAIYSPHTAWDNARHGINAQLASFLGLGNVGPLRPVELGPEHAGLGTGRIGDLRSPSTLAAVASLLRQHLRLSQIMVNLPSMTPCRRVAIVCGSGGSMVDEAWRRGADLLVTGEATYHQFLEAQSLGMSLMAIGHFESEGFAMESLASQLKTHFPRLDIWRSTDEVDSMLRLD